ncbi:MAG: crossover junction endodeoxyribonuclease RuvC [Bdellovibrionales bacterium GWB1_55_8]|nr:MAG: crossover junction endodeoxyribonuclease RuvC [Bdellovibrionales bacterium GWB1_55_8]
MRILGVDPGSRLTGYGCVDWVGNRLVHVAHGTLRLANTSGKATVPLEERLLLLHQGLSQVIQELRPEVLAIERVFFAKNAVSALKLGQARGAAILTGMIHSVKIVEYSATEVKLAVVGHGQAGKEQVAKMVTLLTGCKDFETADASDGLALAICHAHSTRALVSSGSDYARALQGISRGKRGRSGSLAEALGFSPSGKGINRGIPRSSK